MRLSEYKAGTILVASDGKVFIHDGFVNADGYGVIIGEDSEGMIQKSNGIGNWMKCHIKGVATKEQIRGFFANYNEGAIYFKNKEDAQAVIDNPNFRSILDAIYKD